MPNAGDIIRHIRNGKLVYDIWAVCPICGKSRWVNRSNTYNGRFTGLCIECYNGNQSITSRRKQRNGYIKIRLSPDDPYYCMGSKPDKRGRRYAFEHRIVMARHLGRPLTDDEVVHHKNDIGDDNRPENLELFISDSEHQKRLYIELRDLRTRVTQLEAEVALLTAQLEKEVKADHLG